jgi:hypothetical protein
VDYLDFEVEVSPAATGEYSVRVLRSPAGEASGTMRFPFDTLALTNRLQALQIALLRSGGTRRNIGLPETKTVQQFGTELWQALFTGDVLSRFEVSRNEARTQNAGLRLKLRFTAPELAALPWEYLYDATRGDYLSLSLATPLVRYISLPEAMEPLAVQPPLRILGLVASPDDLAPLDVEREKQRLELAVDRLRARGLVELEWLPGRTWRDLRQALRLGPWHIFHFIGHGDFDELHGEGVVILADDEGRSHRLTATDLGRFLGDHDPLRLAVLNSCESARGDRADVFSSTAAVLVRRGTPAVVAMQYEITDNAAIEFSRSFYEALADGLPVDTAVAEARKGIAVAIADTLEWGTPVLFMRTPDGVLFQVSARAESMAAGEVAASSGERTEGPAGTEGTDVTPRTTQETWTNGFGASGEAPSRVGLGPTEGGVPIPLRGPFRRTGVTRRLPLAIAGGLLAVSVIVIGVLTGWIPLSPRVEAWASEAAEAFPGADLGKPDGFTRPTQDGEGAYQAFDHGVVYLRPDGKAVPMFGGILGTWRCRLNGQEGTGCNAARTGPLESLGYPKDPEDFKFGEAFQLFDHGGIYCFRGTPPASEPGCHVITEPLHSRWLGMGGARRSGIGLPINDVVTSDQLGGGWLGRFNEGFIFTDFRGDVFVACWYDGRLVETSLKLTDCSGFAQAAKPSPSGPP